MSYFTLSTGETVSNIVEFENSGQRKTIPDKTQLICMVSGAEWVEAATTKSGNYVPRFLRVQLCVRQAGEFKDCMVNHSLRLNDTDLNKADKARKFLAVYDSLSGGKLRALGDKIDDNNAISRALIGTDCLATFGLIESTYVNNAGETVPSANNWVMKVAAKPAAVTVAENQAIMQDAEVSSRAPVAPLVGELDDSDFTY